MTEDEFKAAVKAVINEVSATGRTQANTKIAFELNNYKATQRGSGFSKATKKWCGGCVNRVFKALENYLLHHGT